jgi:hypothetical protein
MTAPGLASGGASARRGLRFSRGEAQLLFLGLAALGAGVLALLKDATGRRVVERVPAIVGPADLPEKKAAPAPLERPEPARSVDLTEDAPDDAPPAPKRRAPARKRPKAEPAGPQYEVILE